VPHRPLSFSWKDASIERNGEARSDSVSCKEDRRGRFSFISYSNKFFRGRGVGLAQACSLGSSPRGGTLLTTRESPDESIIERTQFLASTGVYASLWSLNKFQEISADN
jgi:hypothetical protein